MATKSVRVRGAGESLDKGVIHKWKEIDGSQQDMLATESYGVYVAAIGKRISKKKKERQALKKKSRGGKSTCTVRWTARKSLRRHFE